MEDWQIEMLINTANWIDVTILDEPVKCGKGIKDLIIECQEYVYKELTYPEWIKDILNVR